MKRFVCVHGHFYQPPRENPWLESIELQDSAYPYHDWNERITAECYGPNANSRILDGEGRIIGIVNNYARMSFNFGPTLLSWMGWRYPEVHAAIVEADRVSRDSFSGHGSAIAQAYNHMILPLGSRRDKVTQVVWGIRDFEHRFGRRPEGMWMPETAVDLETLEVLAEQGILFTIVAPNQVARTRARGDAEWRDVSGGRADPSVAYEHALPSGRKIAIFVYDGPVSRAVAFEGLLASGEAFADRILSAHHGGREGVQLAHIATDGESYGHHHRLGEMALARALEIFANHPDVRLTNYGEFLEMHPPAHEIELFENSSWSCVHGVERWKSSCGCNTGRVGWHQEWRGPLREALDWLRDRLEPEYERLGGELLRNPWDARDAYIDVLLDRRVDNMEAWFGEHAVRPLDEGETIRALKLLEMERHAMLMYTSCGWFFDELSGIETVQVIQYAARAIQLAQELNGDGLEEGFLERLSLAHSNLPEYGDGRTIYDKFVRPSRIDLARVAAHYAVSYLFENYKEREQVYGFVIERQEFRTAESGRARLAIGSMRVSSEITREAADLSFGILHFGDHNMTGGVRAFRGSEAFEAMNAEIVEGFERADIPEVIRQLDRHFEGLTYSLRDLFRDEQRRVVDWIVEETLENVRGDYDQIYDRHAPLLQFLRSLNVPAPADLKMAADAALNNRLRTALASEVVDAECIRLLLHDAGEAGVELDAAGLAFRMQARLEQLVAEFRANPEEVEVLERMCALAALYPQFPAEPDLHTTQNIYYGVLQDTMDTFRHRAGRGDEDARRWVELFTNLGNTLRIRVE